MSTTYTPTQYRSNDPYQQRVLQFSAQDSRVYLSRVSNQLLKGFGNDAVIRGFDLISSTFTGDIFEVVIDTGILIQDTTLIEVTEQSTLTIDVSGLDDCTGYLLLYTDYQYIESIGINKFSLKITHVTNNGLTFTTDSSSVSWNPSRNRLYLTSFQFTKGSPNIVVEKTFPTFLYLNGYKYEKKGGLLNFHRTDDEYPANELFYYHLAHRYTGDNAYLLKPQLSSSTGDISPITNLQLTDTYISVSIDEYEITEPYKLLVNTPSDAISYTVSSLTIPTTGSNIGDYVLTHNLNQQYFIIEIYDSDNKLFRPNYINFTDENTLTINFSNVISDLSDSYRIVLVYNNLSIIEFDIDEITDPEFDIDHNLNARNIIIQLIDTSDNLYNSNRTVFNILDVDTITINTNYCDLIEGTYQLLIYDNVEYAYNLFNNQTYTIDYTLIAERIHDSDLIDGDFYIDHDFKDSLPACGVIDDDLNIAFPMDIEIIDEDNVTFSITSVTSGSSGTTDLFAAYVYTNPKNKVYSLTSLTSGTSGTDNNLTYLLDVSDRYYENIVFQVYNSENKMIFPGNIIQLVENEQYLFVFTEDFDPTDVNILLLQGFYSYSETFMTPVDYAPVVIDHELNSLYVFVNVFDESGEVVYPDNITIIDKDSLSIITTDLVASENYTINIVTGINKLPNSYTKDYSYYLEFSDNDFDSLSVQSLTITHNLSCEYPIIQVYDEDDTLAFPNIKIIDVNTIELTFSEGIELLPYYKVVIIKPH
jgi:hypothetical protein